MPGPEQFSATQRLYVSARLAATRRAAELEDGRRRIESDPAHSEEDKAKALGALREALRAHDRALTRIEEAIGEELPSGALYERIAAEVEAEEAEGVDVQAKATAELRDQLDRADDDAARAVAGLREAAGFRPPV